MEFGGILQVYVIVVYRNLLPLCDGGHLDGCEADGVAAEIIYENTVGHLYYAYGIRLCYNPVAFTHLGTCLVHRDIGNYHRLPFQFGDCLGGEVGNINAGVYFFAPKPLVAPGTECVPAAVGPLPIRVGYSNGGNTLACMGVELSPDIGPAGYDTGIYGRIPAPSGVKYNLIVPPPVFYIVRNVVGVYQGPGVELADRGGQNIF